MTEDEAKTKWCPMARWTTEVASGPERKHISGNWNRNDGPDCSPLCIASGCMAWRWQGVMMKPDGEEAYGFCGLAGKP